jgi:hypothetical protein
VFELTVKDNKGLESFSTVTVTDKHNVPSVLSQPLPSPWLQTLSPHITEPIKQPPPIANAGQDQIVNSGDRGSLNGSKSYATNNTITEYSWRQFAGPSVNLNNLNTTTPSFIAPIVSNDTILKFSLDIKDDNGVSSNLSNVTIFVKPLSILPLNGITTHPPSNDTTFKQQSNATGKLTYTNSKYGIAINYPSDWIKKEGSRGDTKSTGSFKDIVTFLPTKFINDTSNPVEEDVQIDTKPKLKLDSILKDEIATYTKDKYYKSVHVISSDTQSTLAGHQAFSFIINFKENDTLSTILKTGTLIDKRIYSVYYYVDSDKYQTYLAIAQNMIKSFKISNPS